MMEQALILALCVYFIHACTWEGMIFYPVSSKLWNLTPWLKKPLFACPICMSPWYGSFLIWLFSWHWSLALLLSAGGITVVLDVVINALTNGRK